jgi:thioredoxin-related protein
MKNDHGIKKALWMLSLVFLAGSPAAPTRAGDVWVTDFGKASETAKASNRYMLLDFSGSDWCGWCIKLDKEVFSQKAFEKYAKDNLVCVLLDFPRQKALKKELKDQNTELQQKYQIRGFPTVIVLSPDGEKVAQTGYQAGGADRYVEHLKGFIDPHRQQNKVPEPTALKDNKRPRAAGAGETHGGTLKLAARDESRDMRTWKPKTGAELTAALLEEKGTAVILKKEDGRQVQIQKSRLGGADVEYIEGQRSPAAGVGGTE